MTDTRPNLGNYMTADTIEHAETESLDANKTARADTQSPDVDLDGSGGPTRHPDRAAHGTEPELRQLFESIGFDQIRNPRLARRYQSIINRQPSRR